MTSQNPREELGIKAPLEQNFPLLMQSAKAKSSNDGRQDATILSPTGPLLNSLTHTREFIS